jgi:four helix bundle protein
MDLKDLEVYRLAREASHDAWGIYQGLEWQMKKIVGDQFITAVDSIGANIAEGFGRYHYLDRNKFNYNARGSLLEALHWLDLLSERECVDPDRYTHLEQKLRRLMVKLNNFIVATKERKKLK